MKKRVVSMATPLALIAVIFSVVAFSGSVATPLQDSEKSGKARPKKLREIALERDVEVEGVDGAHLDSPSFESLTEASAIVFGRIVDSKAFFDESSPIEYGESITTEYTVEVFRVLKDKTLDTLPPPEQAQPAPLYTTVKIARNGGAVNVNGHRAAIKVKGYEFLKPRRQYVFFLFWSPAYKAYVLAHGISGVVMVNEDLSLKPLASSKEIRAKLIGMDLEMLINHVK